MSVVVLDVAKLRGLVNIGVYHKAEIGANAKDEDASDVPFTGVLFDMKK